MGLKEPTRVSVGRAIFLCALAIFSPTRFDAIESADLRLLDKQVNDIPSSRIDFLRRALIQSFVLVIVSAIVGLALSVPACRYFGRSDFWISALQIVGAMFFLWATLAVRGWDVQTFSGVTLTERVNQWIYRFLYCIATSILILTIALAYCH